MYLHLVQMMGHLMAVKDKQTTADTMFEPLKSTIELLKTYGQELNDDVHLQVQVRTLMVEMTMIWALDLQYIQAMCILVLYSL